MNTEKLIDKIPDIYFDWYARFLPGVIAIIFYFLIGQEAPVITATYLFIYAATAYVLGHIIQPLSSLLVLGIQKTIGCNEAKYEAAKKNEQLTSPTSKVSKAHAESVGMLSSGLLIILAAYYLNIWNYISIGLIAYLILSSVERAFARKRKIEAL